ncbi:hypothetical protein GCM10007890_50500 [Methylobacterium tardum]|uniref:Uncharacterized protein n=1 Tax=Methylobacterium tardum TaxID=374432 RepID=A0AA37TJK0_9HYPH|nr:hypothetical protein GCM10007890_50500 [Methylobacterium tardum]
MTPHLIRVRSRGHADPEDPTWPRIRQTDGWYCLSFEAVATSLCITEGEHGPRFKADTRKATPPTSAASIERELAFGQLQSLKPVDVSH